MGFISPQEVYDDPKRWLELVHGLHESLLSLMGELFPDFEEKLAEAKVHCLQCEGHEPIEVLGRDTWEPGRVTGYVGDLGSVELLMVCPVGEEVEA